MSPTPQIKFGTDGWRAIIADEFTFSNVRICAQSLADEINASGVSRHRVVVAYDTRFASDRFAIATAEVFAGNNIHVSLIDTPTPTPAASFAVTKTGSEAGVIITASHNPAEYNGFKVKSNQGSSADPETVSRLEKRIANGVNVRLTNIDQAISTGHVTRIETAASFTESVEKLVDIESIRSSSLRVAVDAMYGAGAGFLPQILSGGQLKVSEINSLPNPAFPGIVQPEPIGSNLKQLAVKVRGGKYHVGLALDGDADRVGVIDEKGNYLSTLEVFTIIAHHLIKGRSQRGAIACTITMSSMVDKLSKKYGVDVHRTPVGFKYVGPKMLETNAMIGGEESGGYAFRGHVPERDGILSSLVFLEAMATSGKSPSELLSELHTVTGPHVFKRFDHEFIEGRQSDIKSRLFDIKPTSLAGIPVDEIDHRDGVWFRLNGGAWAITRFSGTEPLLRTYAEAHDEITVDRLHVALKQLAGI